MRTENPLSGWPPTRPLRKNAGYRVEARHLTPGRAKLADLLAMLIGLAVIALAVIAAFDGAFQTDYEIYVAIGVVTVFLVVIWGYSHRIALSLFGKTTRIEVRPDVIRIGGPFGYTNYDRGIWHNFECVVHDEAREEAEYAERVARQAERQTKAPAAVPKYYRDSWHVILRYDGRRVDITTVLGKRKAEDLLTRLHQLDRLMDAARGEITGRVRPEPQEQYGPRPETD